MAAVALLFSGCTAGGDKFSADLSYVRAAGLGYRNAGLYSAGYLFLWDKSKNEMTLLSDEIEFEKAPTSESPTTLKSTSVSGVSINGNFQTPAEKLAAELSFSKKIEFTAENAVRERYRSTITALSNAYLKGVNGGEDMRARWYVGEATRPDSSLRYVLITGLVRANSAKASIGGKSGNEVGALSLDVPSVGSIKVAIDRGTQVDCTGIQAPCFFEPTVLKPYIASNGNLDFRVDAAGDRGALSKAWQTLDR